jgi:hypothetical protein
MKLRKSTAVLMICDLFQTGVQPKQISGGSLIVNKNQKMKKSVALFLVILFTDGEIR